VIPPKLQKVLADAGHGSRRACEQIIREGRVTVNGERARLGVRADPNTDVILVDGSRLAPPQAMRYLVLHKPAGVLCSARSQGGWPTVLDLIASPVRLYPVGRLDLNSEGLVLMTNDGQIAHRLSHPSWGHEKEYRVLLDRIPTEDQLRQWRAGLRLPDGQEVRGAQVWLEAGGSREVWLRVVLYQGLKRQIRRTAEALGLNVLRLIRVRLGPLDLQGLELGGWRDLTEEEMIRLRSTVEG
jgi:23S rRNA pseudouridine2605 synthase